jgi:integrase
MGLPILCRRSDRRLLGTAACMRGFIRRRGASWELRVYLGRDPVSGRKSYATRSVRGPRRDAERVLREMVAAVEAGATHRAGAAFGELCEAWLAHAEAQLAVNTVVETRRILDRMLLPELGQVPLAKLRPQHLDALYARLLREGHDGRPPSGSTVRRAHGVARRALTVGVSWGWLGANPAFVAMAPRAIRRPIQPPGPTEVARLIAAATAGAPDLAALLAVAATTGARRGDRVRFHDIRHFVATRLLAAGVDLRTVAGRLGHSKASTTLNVYAAFVPDADHQAADVMAALLTANVRSEVPARQSSAVANPAADLSRE